MNVTTIPLTRMAGLALAAGTILLQCACSGGARHESTEVYDLVTANTHIAYWEEASAGLAAAAKDLGVRAETIGPDTYDPQAERDALLKAIHQNLKPAGFLVSAADPDLMRGAIDEAVAAGIPVITIDADSPKSKRQFFIGTNNYQAGQMGGEIVAKELNGKGNVVVFSLPAQENQEERLEGYKRAFARQPGIKITQVVDVHGEPAKVFDMTRELTAKALSRNKLAMPTSSARLDFVVPVAVKFVATDLHLSQIRVRYLDPRLIGFGIQLSMNL